MLSFEGEGFAQPKREALEAFCAKLEDHPHGGGAEGRIVVAEARSEGMIRALQKYMKDDEYDSWFARLPERTVVTGGKTFVADDEILTAVVAPLPGQALLDLAAHEAIEIAHAVHQIESGFVRPTNPDEADGLTLYDEYRVERARREISNELGWPEGATDAVQGMRAVIDEIASRMPSRRFDPPHMDFFGAWLEMAQALVMACGRGAGGSQSALEDVRKWSEHPLVADNGWEPVQSSLDDLYEQPGLGLEELAPVTASLIRRPIIEYGRDAWRRGP